jgi:dihydrofolate reductase
MMKNKELRDMNGKVVLDMAMSLDGLIAAANDEDGGLHDYFFSPVGETVKVIEDGFKTTGAILMGRRSYDTGAKQDGFADNPYQVPTFVLTSKVPTALSKGAESFAFVTNGMESAIKQAKAAARDREVVVGGGAETAQRLLQAGLIDEIYIHLVPVLLGEGKRLFNSTDCKLERIYVIDAPDVTHLRYRVIK